MTKSESSFEFWKDKNQIQIGQCRILINLAKTKEFYEIQPKITDNCSCGDCKSFEDEVIKTPNKLFQLLESMKVDLSRQPNINPDGVCSIQIDDVSIGFMGYYIVFGQIRKTSKKTKIINEVGEVEEVKFNDAEFGKGIQVTIKQMDKERLSFEFYMVVKRSKAFANTHAKKSGW